MNRLHFLFREMSGDFPIKWLVVKNKSAKLKAAAFGKSSIEGYCTINHQTFPLKIEL